MVALMLGVSKTILLATCTSGLASCAMVRGYRVDVLHDPNVFSFEHRVHDSIAKGDFRIFESPKRPK